MTGIIILPQRQTALVAKQAAEVDLLTEGRFRLGVGLGWNAVEYEALGKDFSTAADRRRRADRAAAPAVDRARGDPRRRATSASPAPAWRRCRCSGRSRSGSAARRRAAYRRIGRLADGWFPQVPPGPTARRGAWRSSPRPRPRPGATRRPSAWRAGSAGAEAASTGSSTTSGRWRDAGATHLAVNTMSAGLGSVDGHLAALAQAADALAPLDTG